jgi:hypothetical protein
LKSKAKHLTAKLGYEFNSFLSPTPLELETTPTPNYRETQSTPDLNTPWFLVRSDSDAAIPMIVRTFQEVAVSLSLLAKHGKPPLRRS